MHLNGISRFDFGIERTIARKSEPEFDLVSDLEACLVRFDISLDIKRTFLTLCVDFEGVELVVDEVVVDDGVGEAGEVGPGVDFDTFGFGHVSQLNKKAKSIKY